MTTKEFSNDERIILQYLVLKTLAHPEKNQNVGPILDMGFNYSEIALMMGALKELEMFKDDSLEVNARGHNKLAELELIVHPLIEQRILHWTINMLFTYMDRNSFEQRQLDQVSWFVRELAERKENPYLQRIQQLKQALTKIRAMVTIDDNAVRPLSGAQALDIFNLCTDMISDKTYGIDENPE